MTRSALTRRSSSGFRLDEQASGVARAAAPEGEHAVDRGVLAYDRHVLLELLLQRGERGVLGRLERPDQTALLIESTVKPISREPRRAAAIGVSPASR